MSSYLLNQLNLSKCDTIALYRILDGQVILDAESNLYRKLYQHYKKEIPKCEREQNGVAWLTARIHSEFQALHRDTVGQI